MLGNRRRGIAASVALLVSAACCLAPSDAAAIELPLFGTETRDDGVARGEARQDLDVPLAPALRGCRVSAITLAGLQRTRPTVIRRELVVAEGRPLRQEALRESVRRLRNLGIFRRVDVAVQPEPRAPTATDASMTTDATALPATATRCTVALSFDEKWTLLPIFSLGRGGAITFLTVGVQDIHLLGRLLTLEAFWQNFGGVNSAGLVFANPRLADRRIHLGLSIGLLRRNRGRFDGSSPAAPSDRAALPPYSRHRWQVGVDLADLRRPERTWRASLWWIDDRFDTALLDSPLADDARAHGVPARRRWIALGLGGRLGRVDYDDYLERGAMLDVGLLGGVAAPGFPAPAGDAFLRGTLTAKLALLPRKRINVVGRVALMAIDHVVEELGVYVGGLDGVRGLPDSRFLGRVGAVANLEVRTSLLHDRWLALQNATFCDVGQAADRPAALFAEAVPFACGTGVRVILPTVARFVARADVAWAPIERGGWLISFGAQQAF
ncbi:MAG: hypothetical protein H6747_14110 [Deltaproteobacteria bacterium]|nr:hypothetical protein [Deltaproteobacteria bacterium]